MNDKQKVFIMVSAGSFVVLLVTIFGLGFLPYTVHDSKGYESDPLMYVFDTKMIEMVEIEVEHQYPIHKADRDYRVEHYYKYLDDIEKEKFDRYVNETIKYKKWLQSPSDKSYYFRPKRIFKSEPIINPTSPSINWLGIIAIFNIAFSTSGFFLFKNK